MALKKIREKSDIFSAIFIFLGIKHSHHIFYTFRQMSTSNKITNSATVQEEILTDDDKRFFLFPLKYPETYKMYKLHKSMFWDTPEIDMVNDSKAYEKLDKNTQKFIGMVLSFFSSADAVVMCNINMNFLNDIKPLEHQMFLSWQAGAESVHQETYSLLLESIIKDEDKRNEMIHGVLNFNCLKRKHEWVLDHMDPKKPFAERLIAFTILEGIFFSSAFASIYWLAKQGIEMYGLIQSNRAIAIDEGLHYKFGCHVYGQLKNKLSQERIHEIMKEACEIEEACCKEELDCALIGMNHILMTQYVHFVADRMLVDIGYDKIWNVENPFEFMNLIAQTKKGNFFEIGYLLGEYSKSDIEHTFSIDEDF